MVEERKMLYIAVCVNFFVGVIFGFILFFGQMKTDASVFESGYTYDTNITFFDFLRVGGHNLLWMGAIFIVYNMLPAQIFHPVMMIRGCFCTFAVMYIIYFMGVREVAVAVLPQCLSVLPMLSFFSVQTVIRRKKRVESEAEPFGIKRQEVALFVAQAFLTAGAELIFFRIFCGCLL